MTTVERNELIVQHIPYAERLAHLECGLRPRLRIDDAASAALCGLVEAAQRYDGRQDFKTYARRRIVGSILDQCRQNAWGTRRRREHVSAVADQGGQAGEQWLELLDSLDDRRRQVVLSYYRDGRTYREIGQDLRLSVSGVHKLMNSAWEDIKRDLSDA